jgi:protoporphyrinogen oxidase
MAPLRELTRRQMLAALAAAPLACTLPRARRLPEGRLVGASFARGHRLRDGVAPTLPADATRTRVRVLVVGGGVAGLSAAWRMSRAGFHDFLVLELEDTAGGTARGGVTAGQAHPWGAHYIAAPRREHTALVRLLNEMGVLDGQDAAGDPLVAEPYLVRDPEERLYYRGRWSEGLYLHAGESAADRAQLAAFEAEVARWVGFRDARGRRAFDLPVARCSDAPEVRALDRLSMAEWLDARGFTSPRLRWLVDYACRDDYGAHPAQVSAWAGLFYFCARVRAPGEESAPLVTWPEGNGRLVAHLLEAARERVRTGWTVLDVDPQDDGVNVIASDAAGTLAGFVAERVIFAAPQFVAARVLRPWRQRPPAHVAAFPYGSWMVANLAVRARPAGRGFPLAWDNVLHDGAGLGYVVASHQEGRDHGPTVLTYYLPLESRRQLYDGDWEHWARATLADLARAHPDLPELCTRLDVMRWGHAMVRPAPGLIWGGARAAAQAPVCGVHFAHTELSGVALFEEALDQGVRAAEEVLPACGLAVGSWRA